MVVLWWCYSSLRSCSSYVSNCNTDMLVIFDCCSDAEVRKTYWKTHDSLNHYDSTSDTNGGTWTSLACFAQHSTAMQTEEQHTNRDCETHDSSPRTESMQVDNNHWTYTSMRMNILSLGWYDKPHNSYNATIISNIQCNCFGITRRIQDPGTMKVVLARTRLTCCANMCANNNKQQYMHLQRPHTHTFVNMHVKWYINGQRTYSLGYPRCCLPI